MSDPSPLSRRSFLTAAAVAGAAGAANVALPSTAARADPLPRWRRPDSRDGRDLLIEGATVLTMDSGLGDLSNADIHIADGVIVDVGQGLQVRNAQRLRAHDMIAIPGLVETHWHMWTGLARASTTGLPDGGYLSYLERFGPAYRPEDTERAVALALAEAVNGGVTTVHDWSHNLRGPEWADASLQAHAASGVRGRFSYGAPQGITPERPIDLDDIARVQRDWIDRARAPLTALGVAVRGPDASEPSAYRTEWEAARDLGLPLTMHAQPRSNTGVIKRLGSEGLLGTDVQLVHAIYADQADRDLMAQTGTTLSVSPASELLFGWGAPQTVSMLEAGVGVSLSIDNTILVGQANAFDVMRMTLGLGATSLGAELGFAPRRVLELATISGAVDLAWTR